MRQLSVVICLGLSLAGCADKDEYQLVMTVQVENTARPCGPGIQYCIDSNPASGELTGRLNLEGTPHLYVRAGCEGDGERVGDSVFVSFARAGVGTCYSFNIRVLVDGDRVAGIWGEGSDGHGGGKAGALVGFRD